MILKNFLALTIKDLDSIYVSKHNFLYIYNISSNSLNKVFEFPSNLKTRISQIHPIFRRVLRTDIRYAFPISSNKLLVVKDCKIYRINIEDNIIESIVEIPRGSRPLNMVEIANIKGFDNGIYFGEYFDNPKMEQVHIYKYQNDHLKKVYTFKKNLINHIHNLIPDPWRNCVWILAGDFKGAASIYKATYNFKDIKKIAFGNQIFRACVAFPLSEGLLYATDSQFQQNTVRILKFDNEKNWISKELFPINGSCIYGTKINNKFYFSTAVEAINSGTKLQKYLRNKRGPGIIKNQTEIVEMDPAYNFKIIYSNKKDILPFVLFQFGNTIFPTGINTTNHLIFTTIATKNNDFSTTLIKLKS